MSIVKTISKNIKKFRITSIDALAKKAGVSPYTLQKIIYCQKKDVQVSTLQKIAKALEISMDQLVK